MNLIVSFTNYLVSSGGKSEKTADAYESDLKVFVDFLNKEKGITELNKSTVKDIEITDIHNFLYYLQHERDNSETARSRKVASLKSFFKYLVNKIGVIKIDITLNLESPKIPKKNPKYLNLEDAKRLIESIDNKRDKAIIITLLNTGLRNSELTSIKLSDLRKNCVTITGKGNKQREIYLNESCIKAINEYIEERESKLNILFVTRYGKPLTIQSLNDIVNKYTSRLGLEGITPHKLRHSLASILYKNGTDIRTIQEMLGHSSLTSTQIYVHVDNKEIENAFNSNPLNM